jgi:hypothetical protein
MASNLRLGPDFPLPGTAASVDSQSEVDASSSPQELLYKIVTILEIQLSELNGKVGTVDATLKGLDVNISAVGSDAIGGDAVGGAGGNATATAIAHVIAIANAHGRDRLQSYQSLPQRLDDIEKHLKHIEKRLTLVAAAALLCKEDCGGEIHFQAACKNGRGRHIA